MATTASEIEFMTERSDPPDTPELRRRWMEDGDESALSVLLFEEVQRLFSRLRSDAIRRGLVRSKRTLDSVMDHTLVDAYKARSRLPIGDPDDLRKYVYTIAWRRLLKARLKRSRLAGRETALDAAGETAGGERPEDAAILGEDALRVHVLLGLLRQPYREVLTLLYFENLTRKDISARLGVTVDAARQRIDAAEDAFACEMRRWESLRR